MKTPRNLPSILLATALGLMPAACIKGPGFLQQGTAVQKTGATSSTNAVIVASEETSAGVVTAPLAVTSDTTQIMQASKQAAIAGSQVAFPPGTLAVATNVTMEDGASLATTSFAQDVGIGADNGVTSSGPALTISSSVPLDAAQPFTISLPLPSSSGLALSDPLDRLVIFYKVTIAATGKIVAGVLTRQQITLDGGFASFAAEHFGSFQAVLMAQPVAAPVQAESKTPILTKAEAQKQDDGFRTTTFKINAPSGPLTAKDAPISWEAVAGAVAYDVRVATDAACSNAVFSVKDAVGQTVALPLLADGAYYVCVAAKNAEGVAVKAANDGLPLLISMEAPGAFSISAPSSIATTSTPTVGWTGATKAATYTLKISSTSGCGSPVQTYDALTTTSQMLTTLSDGTYYACVKAVDQSGHVTAAANDDFAFTIDTVAPPSATITGPASPTSSTTPTVTWTQVPGAASYDLKISSSNACTGDVQSYTGLTGTSKNLTALADGPYFLCVSTRDAAGNASAPTFTAIAVDSVPSGAFTLTGPSPGSLQRETPTVTWNASSGATTYSLKITTDAGCTTAVQTQTTNSTSWLLSPLTSGTYYACVTAVDTAGNLRAATNNGTPFIVPAPLVLGQPDFNSNVNIVNGLQAPVGVQVTGGRVFVADTADNRVLIYNSIPGSSFATADVVLGQPDLETTTGNGNGLSASSMLQPASVYFDGSHLIVADRGNNRILIWNSLPTSNWQPADIVVGQTSMTTSTSGLGNGGLNQPSGVYSDGSRLVVADKLNNRVLVWNPFPTTNGEPASVVLGQPSFASGTPNNGGITATALSAPAGVTGNGSRLYVADSGNHRVLIWTSPVTTNQQAADLVLGQSTMATAASVAAGAATLKGPSSVSTDGTSVFVADTTNNRILKWNTPPSTNTQAADVVLGQAGFTGSTALTRSAQSLASPMSVSTDGSLLIAADAGSNRILLWNPVPSSNQAAASVAIGQPDLTSYAPLNPGVSAQTMFKPTSVCSNGSSLAVADEGNNRVLIWSTTPTSTAVPATVVLGQPSSTVTAANAGGSATAATLSAPAAVACAGGRLFVSDSANNRVLIWNTFPTSSQPPDVVVGQSTMTGVGTGTTASTLNSPKGIYSDGGSLYVVDRLNHRVLKWNSIPSTSGQPADVVLGQTNMTIGSARAASNADFVEPWSVGSDGTRVYVADMAANRILVWNSPPSSNYPPADAVLGQPNFASSSSNSGGVSAQSLSAPHHVHSDGTRLYVADTGNNRVLIWEGSPTSNSVAADHVLGQGSMTSAFGALGPMALFGPFGVYSDGVRIFVADAVNNRVVMHPAP